MSAGLAPYAFGTQLPSNEWNCEGQLLYMREWISASVAAVIAFLYLCVWAWSIWKRTTHRYPVLCIHVFGLLFIAYTTQSVSMYGHWWYADAMYHFTWGLVYILFFIAVGRQIFEDGPGYYVTIWLVFLWMIFAVIGVDALGFNYNITVLVFAMVPKAILFIILFVWIFVPPICDAQYMVNGKEGYVQTLDSQAKNGIKPSKAHHEPNPKAKAKEVSIFLGVQIIVVLIAFLFWALDFWMCNSIARYGFYAVYLVFSSWAVYNITNYLGYIASCYAGVQVKFHGSAAIWSYCVGPLKASTKEHDKQETQRLLQSSVVVVTTSSHAQGEEPFVFA